MTTYKGETLEPRVADFDEESSIQRMLEIREKLKVLSTEYSNLIQSLPTKEPLVCEVDGEHRTYIVDAPTGHFVTYRELDMVMDAKTTKADLKALDL